MEKKYGYDSSEFIKLNPMLFWWIILSLIHVCIVYGWSYLLYNLDIIKLPNGFYKPWITLLFFFGYWSVFETFY